MEDLPPSTKTLTGVKRGRGGQASTGGVRAPSRSGGNHVITERNRRDRINNGFDELRKVIPTEDVKLDKAAFLHIAVGYISNMQGLLQRAIDAGALENLSEENQWALRMLLPRLDTHSPCPKPAAASLKDTPATHLALNHKPKVTPASQPAASTEIARVDNPMAPQAQHEGVKMSALPAGPMSPGDVDPAMLMATASACMLNMMQQQQALLSMLMAQSVKKVDPAWPGGQENAGINDMTNMMYLQFLQQTMLANPLGPLTIPGMGLPFNTTCGAGNAKEAAAATCGTADDNDAFEGEEYTGLDVGRDSGRPTKVRKCSSTAAVLGKATNAQMRPSGMSAGRPGM